MFYYCPQCGLIQKKNTTICPVCEFTLNNVPAQFLSKEGNLFLSQEARNEFIDSVILTGKEFNKELASNRDNILAKKNFKHQQEITQKVQEYKNTKPVHCCPVCHSNNLTTISNVGKAAKIALIGVWGAGDLGKKWRCNSCGYKF